jgi:hypothetical protein
MKWRGCIFGALDNLMVVVIASAYCSKVADQSVILGVEQEKGDELLTISHVEALQDFLEDMYSESVLGFPEISTVRRGCCI